MTVFSRHVSKIRFALVTLNTIKHILFSGNVFGDGASFNVVAGVIVDTLGRIGILVINSTWRLYIDIGIIVLMLIWLTKVLWYEYILTDVI